MYRLIDYPPNFTPVDKNDNFYLIGQQRYAVNEYSWEFPNGGIENEEKPDEAAVRELGEETEKEIKELHYLEYFHPVNNLMNRNVHVFLRTTLSLQEAKHGKLMIAKD